MIVHIELTDNQAAALFRLCDKLTHNDAKAYLYPHIDAGVRADQASTMCQAAALVCSALQLADVPCASAWPWIDTGEAK